MKKMITAAAGLLLLTAAIDFGQTRNNYKKPTKSRKSSAQKKMPDSTKKNAASNQSQNVGGEQTAFALPANQDAWIVEIRTSGGLTGSGVGDFFAVSTGYFSLDGANVNGKVSNSADLQILSNFIKTANFARTSDSPGNLAPGLDEPTTVKNTDGAKPGQCNDCINTAVTVRRRDASGTIKTFSANWNENTMPQIAGDFISVYTRAMELKPKNAQPEIR